MSGETRSIWAPYSVRLERVVSLPLIPEAERRLAMDMQQGVFLEVLGLLLLGGYTAHVLGARAHVPRVTLLLLMGMLSGPHALGLVPADASDWFSLATRMTLAMVGFLLGESFIGKDFKETGRMVLGVSIGVTLATAAVMFTSFLVAGASVALALLVAGVAPATDPAATLDIVREGRGKGLLTNIVLGVVAVDDAWGIMLFSLMLATAEGVTGAGNLMTEFVLGLWEVVGAVMVGGLLGFPMAWLTGKLKKGQPALLEAVGFVFLCAGAAIMLHVSYLLASMVLGAVVANRARHYTRPFHAIRGVLDPFLAIFFLLAGMQFNPTNLLGIGLLSGVYVVARVGGRVLGGQLGGRLGGAPPVVQTRVGWCLLPQAGVSVGLALLAQERLPEVGALLLPLVIATTVLFEVTAPFITRWQLRKAGELYPPDPDYISTRGHTW